MGKVKCKKYNSCSTLCLACDIVSNQQCAIRFDFDTPKKYAPVQRRDHFNVGWNECPTCGNSIGYHPEVKDFRCSRCRQRILW